MGIPRTPVFHRDPCSPITTPLPSVPESPHQGFRVVKTLAGLTYLACEQVSEDFHELAWSRLSGTLPVVTIHKSVLVVTKVNNNIFFDLTRVGQ